MNRTTIIIIVAIVLVAAGGAYIFLMGPSENATDPLKGKNKLNGGGAKGSKKRKMRGSSNQISDVVQDFKENNEPAFDLNAPAETIYEVLKDPSIGWEQISQSQYNSIAQAQELGHFPNFQLRQRYA